VSDLLLYAEFANADEVFAGFSEARTILKKMLVAYDVARIVHEAMHSEAPEGCTGKLRQGIGAKPVIEPNGFTVEATSKETYTKWVIGGRGEVRPVRAKVLHWKTCSGEDVFAMYAKAVPPNPFHERGWQKAQPAISQKWVMFGGEVAAVLAT